MTLSRFKVNKPKAYNRRKFLRVAGTATAGTIVTAGAAQQLSSRFVQERLGDLVKPCSRVSHRPTPEKWSDNAITATLLGHSTVLLNFYGVKIITDPVLFSRIGANFGFFTMGPLRREACALKPSELPKVDLILLSHAHLDHFDIPSLRSLNPQAKVVTASNTTDLFQDTNLHDITELGWGQSSRVQSSSGDVEIKAFQVKHWGARWRHDTQRGYNGYVLRRGGKQIIFGGDTAMCPEFKTLKNNEKYALAMMPIGAYQPWVNSHCNPEQALQMANEAGAEYILPMHFYTFRLGREICTEPMDRMQAALSSEKQRLGWTRAGETFSLPA